MLGRQSVRLKRVFKLMPLMLPNEMTNGVKLTLKIFTCGQRWGDKLLYSRGGELQVSSRC